jgi:hypothetical protein
VNAEVLLRKWDAQSLGPDEFRSTFQREWLSLQSQFFKYEACQYYAHSEDPSFDALMEGKLYKAARIVSEQIVTNQRMYDDARGRQISLTRVRAIRQPLSYYLQYEFISYLTSQQLGEKIRVAKVEDVQELEVEDFILFDDRIALVHNYVFPENRQEGGWLVDHPDGVEYLIHCRDLLVERSGTLDDFIVINRSS